MDRYGEPLPPGAVTRIGKRNDPAGSCWLSLAFAPDSSVLAAGGMGEKATSRIPLWDVKTGREIRTLLEPRRRTNAIAFAPDGKTLASCSGDNTLVLWDIATGEPIFAKRGPINPVKTESISYTAFSPDGRSLASPRIIGVEMSKWGVHLWETASGERRAALHLPDEQGVMDTTIAFSPDGRLLAMGTNSGRVHLFDLATGSLLRTFEKFNGGKWGVSTVLFSPDGTTLIAAAGDTSVKGPGTERPFRVWEVATGKELLRFRGHSRDERRASLSPDGTILASTNGWDNYAYLWDTKTGRELAKLEGHGKPVQALAFSSDGKLLATSGQDRSILIWDLATVPGVKRTAAAKATPPIAVREEAKEPLPQDELEKLWDDLAGADAKKAYRAIWELITHPRESLPLLRVRLLPRERLEAKKVAELLADLDSAEFKVRERARAALRKAGRAVAPALRQTLKQTPSLEVRRNLQELLEYIEQRPLPPGDTLRNLRALEVLEHIGGDEAKKILRAMADGAPGAAETEDAKATLKRLTARRSAEKP
jgi:dipeptidyl aminopeptidase/acylaminoacyl peptidase